MDNIEVARVAALLESNHEALNQYKSRDSLNTFDLMNYEVVSTRSFSDPTVINAITVKDSANNIYVHYFGTQDGTWNQNSAAYGGPPSDMQAWALGYFNETVASSYEGMSAGNLYVTGHSQGGNNAQFVTVRSTYGDYISTCISLDGPGFSERFVNESISGFGEAHYDRQRDKIWAINGASDFVSPQGQVQIMPDGQVLFIETPSKSPSDNFLFVFHDARYLLDGNNNLNPFTQESEFRKFIAAIVVEVNDLSDDQRLKLADIALLLAEDNLGQGAVITQQDLADLKSILIPIVIDVLANNPDMIAPVLIELGIDGSTAESIARLVDEFNKLSPQDRANALNALAECIVIVDGKIDIDLSKISLFSALVPLIPLIWETALHNPGDLINVLTELGFDVMIRDWIIENPGLCIGVVLGFSVLVMMFPMLLPSIVVAIILIDAIIHIIEGLGEIGKALVEKIVVIFNAVKDALNAFARWLDNVINPGTRYASENPYIKVDTNKLREYATRIETVNQRLSALDTALNAIMFQVRFRDALKLAWLDFLTSGSPTLNQVKNFLNQGADRFDAVETEICGYFGG